MLESKLRHNKNQKFKSCKCWDLLIYLLIYMYLFSYPWKFNFGHVFSSIALPVFTGKKRISKSFAWEKWIISFCLEWWYKKPGGEFCLGLWVNMNRFNFWLTNLFSSNINIINLKLFCKHRWTYKSKKKFKKYSEEIKPLGVHRNIRVCILQINSEGIGLWLTVNSLTILLILIWEFRHS